MLASGARPYAQRPMDTLHPCELVAAHQMHAGPDHWTRQPPCLLDTAAWFSMHDDCQKQSLILHSSSRSTLASAPWIKSFHVRCSDVHSPGNGTHPVNATGTSCRHWQQRVAPADAWLKRHMARQSWMPRTAKAAGPQRMQLHWLHGCWHTMPRAAQHRLHGSRLSASDAGPLRIRGC